MQGCVEQKGQGNVNLKKAPFQKSPTTYLFQPFTKIIWFQLAQLSSHGGQLNEEITCSISFLLAVIRNSQNQCLKVSYVYSNILKLGLVYKLQDRIQQRLTNKLKNICVIYVSYYQFCCSAGHEWHVASTVNAPRGAKRALVRVISELLNHKNDNEALNYYYQHYY